MLVAGVDGIKGGWVFVLKDGAEFTLGKATSFSELLWLTAKAAMVAVDMPIGLLEAACPGGRECDRLARQRVGPAKAPAIFSPPCRGALPATSYAEANILNRSSSAFQLGLSQQAYALFGKLREVDAAMTPSHQERVFEVHPEVSFGALRDAVAAGEDGFHPLPPKKRTRGRQQRTELLHRAGFMGVAGLVSEGRPLGAKPADILDACIAAWTAERIAAREAKQLPEVPTRDARGLRMEIWL